MNQWTIVGVILTIAVIAYIIVLPDYKISILDKNKTENIDIIVKNITDGATWTEKTDSNGKWTKIFKFEKNDKIKIVFKKKGYTIEPSSVTSFAYDLEDIVIPIVAIQEGHNVTFNVKNGLAGVKIYHRILSNTNLSKRTLLGQTNSNGNLVVKIIAKQKDIFTFDYEYNGGQIHTNIPTRINTTELPKLINLRVIPNKPIVVKFHSVKSLNANKTVSGVKFVGKNSGDFDYSVFSDFKGLAEGVITPTPDKGPFIGDKIDWSASKSGYKVSPNQSTRIKQNKYTYPAEAGHLQFNLAKEYRLTIKVVEDSQPMSDINVFINKKIKGKTNNIGSLEYLYTDEDLNKIINISINTSGKSANGKNKKLSRGNEIITLNVVTIHAKLDLRDKKSGHSILGQADVILNGKNIGTLGYDGLQKLIFSKFGEYDLIIRTDQYYEKKWKLKISKNNVGHSFIINLTKRPIINVQVAYGGGFPVENATVTPSIGKGGKTDKNGNFIYKVIDPVKSMKKRALSLWIN